MYILRNLANKSDINVAKHGGHGRVSVFRSHKAEMWLSFGVWILNVLANAAVYKCSPAKWPFDEKSNKILGVLRCSFRNMWYALSRLGAWETAGRNPLLNKQFEPPLLGVGGGVCGRRRGRNLRKLCGKCGPHNFPPPCIRLPHRKFVTTRIPENSGRTGAYYTFSQRDISGGKNVTTPVRSSVTPWQLPMPPPTTSKGEVPQDPEFLIDANGPANIFDHRNMPNI